MLYFIPPPTHTHTQAHHVLESGVVFLSSAAANIPPSPSSLEPHQRQPGAQEGKLADSVGGITLLCCVSTLAQQFVLPLSPLFPSLSSLLLCQHYVQMKVELLWDSCCPGVRDPLYLIWLGKGRHCGGHMMVM